jgi:AraC-like DNA-binding protein
MATRSIGRTTIPSKSENALSCGTCELSTLIDGASPELHLNAGALSIRTKRVLDFIQKNVFDVSLNVKVATSVCGISDHNISCQFKREVGLSIKECIVVLRMSAAVRFLERSDLAITEIAYRLGYWHVQTF